LVGEATTEPDSPSRAWLFLPFGLAPAVVVGYVLIAVADGLSRAGVPLSSVSVLVTAAFLPATLMFLWAPLIDVLGSRKRWILGGVLLLCVAAAGLALAPRTVAGLPLLVSLSALAGFGYSLVSAAHKGLAVELLAPERRVAAAGWAGAGSGIGLAMSGGLLVASANLSSLGTALLLAALAGIPPLVSLALLERRIPRHAPDAATLRDVFTDTRHLFGTGSGRLTLALCALPIGSSAVFLMLGALGSDFQSTATFVGAWVGTARSLAMAAGALMGARFWLRLGTKSGCVLSTLALATFSLLVLAVPKTPNGYAFVVCGYGFLSGAALSALAGIILETVGQRASSTQASVLVAAGNLGNVYLPPVGGLAHDAAGLTGLLLVDSAVAVAGLLLYLLCARVLHQHPFRGQHASD
jgi:PAT family beta-lactamase induction signal transducer AmpG